MKGVDVMKLGKVIQHDIHIIPTDNFGFRTKVGCGRFAFSNKEDMVKALTEYLDNPEELEKAYNSLPREASVPDREEPLRTGGAGGSSRPTAEAQDAVRTSS